MLFKDVKFKLLEEFFSVHGDLSVAMFQVAERLDKVPIELFNEMKLTKIIKEYPSFEADIMLSYIVAIMLKYSNADTDVLVLDNIKDILRYERGLTDEVVSMNINLNLN